tara:strand:+ start:70 stop:516 length:447 start_codon:yes stop_codon:yes gene_type:complete
MMEAEQVIKKHLLQKYYDDVNSYADENDAISLIKTSKPYFEAGDIDQAWDNAFEADLDQGWLQEIECEFRGGEALTDISSEYSRHYESKSVAANIDNQWVGWTYWYGGGKHGQPEEIEWMCDAYFLTCKEEVKTVTVRTFEKVEQSEK